jgi:K+-transporting ATPase KdpF subunit
MILENGVIRCLTLSTCLSVACSCSAAGYSPGHATGSDPQPPGGTVDYIVAGVTALGLFVYLIYALLRPERF